LSSRAALYRDNAREAGRAPVICLERDVVVAADGDAARAAWMRRNLPLLEYYRSQGASLPDFPEGASEREGFTAVAAGCAVAGSPDDCIAAIAHARDVMGCEYLQLMNLGAGPGFGHRGNYVTELAALELFGRHVLPAFR
jgi:alkanesulfonate monooxygenase SsuD/methylene tetrahydromethanopterin reductase-like flavin-dependent oxidoreductase (luciferase family)